MSDRRAVLLRRAAPARLESVAELCREAMAALSGVAMTPEGTYAVDLALEEMLTNVAKYAYPGGEPGSVELEVEAGKGDVLLRFSDGGRPFDPLSVPPPPPALSRERPGGLGISLVRSVAKAVLYRRVGDRNVVEVLVPVG